MKRLTSTFIIFVGFVVVTILSACGENPQPSAYQWPILKGFPKPQVPADNPMTIEKVTLGKQLFFDVNLSANRQQSCASCHIQEYAFAENQKQSVGSTGEQHRRNSLALVNVAYNKTLTWAHDGLTSIEQQILLPMFGESPIELGITGNEKEIWQRFQTPEYQQLFKQAFPDNDFASKGFSAIKSNEENVIKNFDYIVKALASYVRSLISLNSPFDLYAYHGQDDAISESALRGMDLFFSEKFECHHCHGGFNFTQSTSHEKQLIDRRPFHNTGLYNTKNDKQKLGYPSVDTGLSEISTLPQDDGRFRAPTLRNIEVTAPYMHDGSIATLSDVLDFYAAGGRNVRHGIYAGDGRLNPLKSPFIKGFEMSEQDKQDLLSFLKTLTDETFLSNAQHGIADMRKKSH